MAGVVMLFHSAMSRMKRTLPDAVEGESDPKTASWRAHHGAMTSRNSATQPTAAPNGIAGRPRLGRPPRPPAIPQEGETEGDHDEDAVVARQRRQTGEQAGAPRRRDRTPSARGAEPQRPDHERLIEREVVRLDEIDRGQQRDGDQHAGAGWR